MSYTLKYTGAEIDDILDRAVEGGTIDEALALKAPLESPALTGTPTAPTPAESDNSTKVATTAYADRAAAGAAAAAYPVDSASGAIASFPDGSDSIPMKSFVCSIEPVQNLNGQSAPYPAGGGKNKAKPTLETVTQSGITYTANADGTVTCTGSSTISTVNYIKVGEVSVTNGQTYILSGCPSGGGQNSYRLDLRTGTSTIYNNAIDNGSGVTFTANADLTIDVYVRFNSSYAITGSLLFKPMVCLSTASDPDYAHYAPYSNVCPIYGHTGVNAVVAGKNLVFSKLTGCTINSVGKITSNAGYDVCIARVKAGVTYTATIDADVSSLIYAYYADMPVGGSTCIGERVSTDNMTFTAAYDGYLGFRVTTGFASAQLEVGPATDYEPYIGTTYPVTFYDGANPLTVYKGSIDLVSGVLTVTGAYVNANTKTWTNSTYSGGDAVYANFTDKVRDTAATCISDTYSTATYSSSDRIVLYDGVSTSAEIQTKIATGDVHILYTLATPLVYQLTPTEVLSLLGINNCFNDCGDTEVIYRADTKLYIDKRLGGNVQTLSAIRPTLGAAIEPTAEGGVENE